MWWLVRLALAFLICGSVAHAATCAEGQQPFAAGSYSGATAADACTAWAAGLGVEFIGTEVRNNNGVSETWCDGDSMFRDSADSFQIVTAVCEPATDPAPTPAPSASSTVVLALPEPSPEDYAAVMAIFAAGVVALVALWGVAGLIRFFDRSPDA
jgi:hypothetical protein